MTKVFYFSENRNRFSARLFIYLILLASPVLLSAQIQQIIQGRIIDDRTKQAVLGATVTVKDSGGKKLTTFTDGGGHFSFNITSYPANLLVEFVGYKDQDIDIYEELKAPLVVELTETRNLLNTVVVVGYGTQKRSEVAGAISSVSVENFKNIPSASFNNLLAGSTAGLQVTPTSGQPGGNVSLRIRGGSSVQGGNEPLYVIDGFPIYNNSISAGTVSGASTNPLASINPGDIESINVLKDASATSIYGSRGANGVIIITTKKGSGEKTNISYESSAGIQSIRKKIDVLNAHDFAILRNNAFYDTDASKGEYQYLSQQEIDALGEGTNWQQEAFREASVQNHQLTITKGSENTHFAISTNYFHQDGIIKNTDFKRFSARINLDSKLTNKLKIGVNLTGSKTSANVAPSGIISSLLLMPPTATVYNANGSYTLRNPFENIFSNPIASLKEQINQTRNYKLLGTAFGEYYIFKNLVVKTLFGINVDNGKEYNYIPKTIYEGASVGGQASLGVVDAYSWLNENTLTYSNTFGKNHSLNFLLGFTQQENKQEIVRTGSSNFVSDDLTFNNLTGGSVITTPYSNNTQNALISYLGRVNYNFAQKYFVTASIRQDGSSRFGQNNKWGLFPSAGLSWYSSKEGFFKPLTTVVNDLKIRVSYGKTGNQEIGNYQSLSTLSTTKYLIGNTLVTGYTPDRISNDNLGWETTYQLDAGFDIGLLKDRILLTIDAYTKKTVDLLLNVEIPWTSGQSTSLQNYGSVQNRGLEFTLNTQNLTGRFRWNSVANISINRNKVLSIGGSATSYVSGNYLVKVGKPLGTFYGAVTDGILQTGEESTKGVFTGNATPKAGDRLYKDISDDGAFTSAADRDIIGNAQPDFTFGLNNSFEYKGFELSVFLQGSVGNQIINSNKQSLELFNGQQNAASCALDRWTPTNPSNTIPRAKLDPAPVFSDRFVEDGSFVRVKNATLGYTIPRSLTKALKISNLKFYVSGSNILTFTKYTGFDPEITSGDNTVSQGTDSGIYPVSRAINFGVNLIF
jgi:TonB-linked SusC/RagA family outer membrane protein